MWRSLPVVMEARRSSPRASLEGRVELTDQAPAFELVLSEERDAAGRSVGPFRLEGSNVTIDPESGALSVDLVVTNLGERSLAEPATLTFGDVAPEGVDVNGVDEADPPSFVLEFENDDAQWTQNETSIPRTIEFVGASSVAFVPEISSAGVDGGVIAGVVFVDRDEDGERDADERGIPDVIVELAGPIEGRVVTGDDGSYAFEGLGTGLFEVHLGAPDGFEPTTATVRSVLLSETDGEVSSFLDADFGGLLRHDDDDDDDVEVGDRVHLKGEWVASDGVFVTREVDVESDEDDDARWGELRGTVTDVDDGVVTILGQAVRLRMHDDDDDDDDKDDRMAATEIGEGDRVRVRVAYPLPDDATSPLVGIRVSRWDGSGDRLLGRVDRLAEDAGRLEVLRTEVLWR